eukprot:GEMP01018578.1.p1 GENE.GEMP01018578.1~~GEMP01018578.1.p1  ORF type:complete len:432 (+),score=62.33 GEMP01018578.1:88-1296(+)
MSSCATVPRQQVPQMPMQSIISGRSPRQRKTLKVTIEPTERTQHCSDAQSRSPRMRLSSKEAPSQPSSHRRLTEPPARSSNEVSSQPSPHARSKESPSSQNSRAKISPRRSRAASAGAPPPKAVASPAVTTSQPDAEETLCIRRIWWELVYGDPIADESSRNVTNIVHVEPNIHCDSNKNVRNYLEKPVNVKSNSALESFVDAYEAFDYNVMDDLNDTSSFFMDEIPKAEDNLAAAERYILRNLTNLAELKRTNTTAERTQPLDPKALYFGFPDLRIRAIDINNERYMYEKLLPTVQLKAKKPRSNASMSSKKGAALRAGKSKCGSAKLTQTCTPTIKRQGSAELVNMELFESYRRFTLSQGARMPHFIEGGPTRKTYPSRKKPKWNAAAMKRLSLITHYWG